MINSFSGDYFYLSNFSPYPVFFGGIQYENSEAAFQAQKCLKFEDREKFSKLNASESKKLGRSVSLRPDWENVKVSLMRDIVKAKFDQNPSLQLRLINTKDEYLEEGNTWGDKTWGTVNGTGANLLGKILMEIREEYIQKAITTDLER